MKHLFNNLSFEEKQNILNQHDGGKKIFNENFDKLMNHKLGNVRPISEQVSPNPSSPQDMINKANTAASGIEACLKSKGVKTELSQTCVDAMNQVIAEAQKIPGGQPPDPSKLTQLGPCFADLGKNFLEALTSIPAFSSCVMEELQKTQKGPIEY